MWLFFTISCCDFQVVLAELLPCNTFSTAGCWLTGWLGLVQPSPRVETSNLGGGGGSGKVNVQDISFTKYVCKASPELMKACMSGRHINEATLVVRKAGDKPLEYMTIKINDIIVSSVSTGGSGGEDRLTENVTLNFSQVDYKYVEQTDTGAEGAKPDVKWDIAKNEAM